MLYGECVGGLSVFCPPGGSGDPRRAYVWGTVISGFVRTQTGTWSVSVPFLRRPERQVIASIYAGGGGTSIIQSLTAGVNPAGTIIQVIPALVAGVLLGMTIRLSPGTGNQQDRIINTIAGDRLSLTPTVPVTNTALYESVPAQILGTAPSPAIYVNEDGPAQLEIQTHSNRLVESFVDLSFDLLIFRGRPTGGLFPLVV